MISPSYCKNPGLIGTHSLLNTVSVPENIWELYLKVTLFSKLLKLTDVAFKIYVRSELFFPLTWVNKNAKRFRRKGCPMFNELGVIFGNPTMKYKDVFPLSQYPLMKESNLNIEDSSTNATPSAFPDETGDDRDYTSQNTQCLRSPTPASHHGGRREVRTVEIIEGSREWTEVSKPLAPTLTRLEASPQSCAFSITNCVKYLESIDGVDEITYIKAIKMFKDVDWREMFMAMSAESRLVWLASLDSLE